MSSVSEQDHLNPRDPLYYAPRSLRERSASRGGSLEKPFSAASFDSQLESAVSDALRHPLDPEVMHDPDMESKKAMWTIAARFAAAIGVAALVALFFVVAVPGSRQSDGEQSSTLSSLAQSFKNALPQSAETANPSATDTTGGRRCGSVWQPTPPTRNASSFLQTRYEKSGHRRFGIHRLAPC